MAKDIRVRYAPSPTGLLHIGNARTALFNYLYARHHGGTFIIRIEDTDRKRHVEDGERSQLDNLRWLGIDWDESPETHENYRQSERLPLYQKYIDQLLAEGKAYKSYVTEEELAAERERQEAAGETPRYINEFLGMTEEEKAAYIAEREAAGIVPTVRLAVNESGIYKWHDIVKGDIEFDDVSFRYPGTKELVLDHVSLKIEPSEKIAVVGKNGSGKTTLVKLLCRLYEPEEGEILWNGKNIREYDLREWQKIFAIVFQDYSLLSLTLGQNVAASEQYEAERAKEVLQLAGFGERLNKLKKGLETVVYPEYEQDGVSFSGGEEQKIAIARAIYKGSQICILDEPTAALDPVSESRVYESFDEIVKGKTAVYISHRLSSCKFSDRIFVLDNGKIVESGTHEALLSKNGLYAQLWQAQAQYYKV